MGVVVHLELPRAVSFSLRGGGNGRHVRHLRREDGLIAFHPAEARSGLPFRPRPAPGERGGDRALPR